MRREKNDVIVSSKEGKNDHVSVLFHVTFHDDHLSVAIGGRQRNRGFDNIETTTRLAYSHASPAPMKRASLLIKECPFSHHLLGEDSSKNPLLSEPVRSVSLPKRAEYY